MLLRQHHIFGSLDCGAELMNWSTDEILDVLDQCAESLTFPILDNGYVYLADSRLSLFRSPDDWQLAIEVFGFSPRSGVPDVSIYHFGSSIVNRKLASDFVSEDAYRNYMNLNPNNETEYVYPIEAPWMQDYWEEVVPESASDVTIRGRAVSLPTMQEYDDASIALEDPPIVGIHELCRVLVTSYRSDLLATNSELRRMIPDTLELVIQLDEWNHPDVIDEACKPSNSETFQQLAKLASTGEVSSYSPSATPNNHWRNWPDGGSL